MDLESGGTGKTGMQGSGPEEAIRAVAASPEARETFLRPPEENTTGLQDAVLSS